MTERTREIGIRGRWAAKRRHIVMQFLIESLMLSTVGGMIGIVCGSAGAHLITNWVGWPTVIHNWTILCSFGLALAVGLFFGITPPPTPPAWTPSRLCARPDQVLNSQCRLWTRPTSCLIYHGSDGLSVF